MITEQGRRVAEHWSRLAATYDGALRWLETRGIAPADARAEDLHALDMIHMGGPAATDALAAMAGIVEGLDVLDIGSGVGGPARRIASRLGARVSGLELSEVLHDVASRLNGLVAMDGQVSLFQGSALTLPFAKAAFDVATLQHVAMQIAEKDQLFGEVARVLRPGGRLALHELFAGEGVVHYPLPWATDPAMSAMETVAACADRLSRLGFEVGDFTDQSAAGRAFHVETIAAYDRALAGNEGASGLTREATETRRAASVAMERNLGSGSVRVGMMIARKVS